MRYGEIVERSAEKIYEALPYDGPGEKPDWVPFGNSHKQDEARRYAFLAIQVVRDKLHMALEPVL